MTQKNLRRVILNLFFILAIVVMIAGCSSQYHSALTQGESQAFTEVPQLEPIDLENPTYTKTIAKLFNRHCTSCHQAGGIAPFSLTGMASVQAMSGPILNAVVNRTMPPPSVDNSGTCQNFTNSTWLKEAEIKAISTWIETGMPVGEAKPPLAAPKPAGLAQPRLELRMAVPYMPQPPAGELDDYRCFIIDPGQSEDTLITAIQVLPDKVAEVHHVIVFKPTSPEAQAAAELKAGSDGRPGFSCFGAAGVPSTVVGLWAPGGKAGEMYDPDTGLLLGLALEKGRKLIMQVHYNTQNGTVADQSAILVKTNKNAVKVKWVVMANFMLSLKPGLPDVVDADTQGSSWWQAVNLIFERGLADDYISGGGLLSAISLDLLKIVLNQPEPRDFKVYGVAPHMHILGSKISVEKISVDDKAMCMASVPKFDFHWQAGYTYVKPLTIAKTDKLRITCHFNTVGRTEKIVFGEGTTDEMCLAFILVAE